MGKKSWYYTGDDGERRGEEVAEEAQARALSTRRFWLKPGNEALVTFLDTTGFFLHEHNLKVGGRWGNYYTCLQEFDNCPLCEAMHRPAYVCVYTIIDHSVYTSKATGKEIKNQKKLLVLKPRALNKLRDRKVRKLEGDLTLSVFRVKRHASDEANTGEDWDLEKRIDIDTIKKVIPKDIPLDERDDYLKPFNYIEIFAPKEADELRRIAGTATPMGADSGSSTTGDTPGPKATGDDDMEKYL